MVFYIRLLSFSIMFLKFTHIIACINISFFLWLTFHCLNVPHCVYSLISWWTVGLVPLFGYYEYVAMNICEKFLCEYTFL